jgi:hypothetical protein
VTIRSIANIQAYHPIKANPTQTAGNHALFNSPTQANKASIERSPTETITAAVSRSGRSGLTKSNGS